MLLQLENITYPMVRESLEDASTRKAPDFNHGWYDSLSMLKLRRLMRYKLRALVDGAVLDMEKVDYILNKLELNEAQQKEEEAENNDAVDEEDEYGVLDEEELEDDYEMDISDADYGEIMKYLEKFNPRGAQELGKLSGILRQASLELD